MNNQQLDNIRIKYQNALNLFIFESQNQWSRYNAMLIVQSILISIIGFYFVADNQNVPSLFKSFFYVLPIIGILICLVWFVMSWKGFQYKKNWMTVAFTLEQDLKGGRMLFNNSSAKKKTLISVEYMAYTVIGLILCIYIFFLIIFFFSKV